MPSSVLVYTGSRIHLGFYRISSRERVFGSIGLALAEPGYAIFVRSYHGWVVRGCQSGEIAGMVERIVEGLGLSLRGAEVRLLSCIPRHRGLGSTTQLLLGLAKALTLLSGAEFNALTAFRVLRRGNVSGIGLYAFIHGGLIVDSGVPREKWAEPRLAMRVPVPSSWGVVLIIPRVEKHIREGDTENNMLARTLSRANASFYEELLDKILPGALSGDIALFGEGVESLQKRVGEVFSAEQGGIYCCPESERAIQALKAAGATGVGQSSWGPLVYGFFPSLKEAARAAERVRRILREEMVELEAVAVTRPRLHGAVAAVL